MTQQLYFGGRILSPPAQAPSFDAGFASFEEPEALLVENGRIAATGKRTELEGALRAGATRHDLQGKLLIPGFNDAHVHVWKVGQLRTTMLDLRGVNNMHEFERLVQERAQTLERGTWLWGRGWNEALLGAWPTRQQLDALAPQNPVLLTRTCAHIHVVNTQGLALAGITPETQVPGGEIRFEDGHLFETAYGLVFRAMPAPSQQDFERWVLAGLQHLRALGITSCTDPAVDPPLLAAYHALAARQELPVRVNTLFIRRPDGGSETFALPERFKSDWLRVDSVKFFADGGLSGATAALSVPYHNTAGPSQGVLRFDDEDLYALALEAQQAGFRIGTHAIGDRALDQVLGVYGRVMQAAPNGVRHRIEHFGLPNQTHLQTAKGLGVMVVPQPVFMDELRENFLRYLPSDFVCRCYNLRAMFETGLTVAFSSDGPVVAQVSPLVGLNAAVNMPMCAGNGVSVAQGLWAYTVGAATASGDQDNRGRLGIGMHADFTVLDGDPKDLTSWQVAQTVVSGS